MADYMSISPELREKIIKHYNNPVIIEKILDSSDGKEVVGSFGGVGYSKRPSTLQYKNDILKQVEKGVTSFHVSEETWRNPLELSPGLEKKKLDNLRIGWDLIIDIDCPNWTISKLITHLLVEEIMAHGIKNVGVKFSGNKGFHIGIAKESFKNQNPQDFPEVPRKISQYLLAQIFHRAQAHVVDILVNEYGEVYCDKIGGVFKKKQEEMVKNGFLDPFSIIEVDTLLITQRHLYRMSYSVNEKSGLISIPINPQKILNFQKDIAKIEHGIISKFDFLNREKCIEGEADSLVTLAKEFSSTGLEAKEYEKQYLNQKEKSDAEIFYEEFREKIPEKYFPESIHKILSAEYNDGKKRAIFVLKNFLSSVGWSYDEIEKLLIEWNEKFTEPLRESILKGQLINLKLQLSQGKILMPPNYSNNNFYSDIIGTHPDYTKAKNPVSLAIRRYKLNNKEVKK